MKRIFSILITLLFISPLFAQQIIQKGGDRVNSYTKTDQAIKAEILLENGKNEKVPVQLTVAMANMNQEDIDLVTNWSSIIDINIKAKYTCSNKTTYVPMSIFMYKSEDGEIGGQLKGVAKNAYGGEGDISIMFSFENGEVKF